MSTTLPIHLPSAGRDYLELATVNQDLHYKLPPGTNWLAVQLTSPTSWTSGAFLTIKISLDGGVTFVNFPDGAITYSALGIQDLLEVTGVTDVQLSVSTAAAGTDLVKPILRAGRDA